MSLDQANIRLKMIDHPLLTQKGLFPRVKEHIFENLNNLLVVINIIFNDFPKNE